MSTAIFGISNSGLNLVVTLLILMVVVVWLALIVYTYLDARRRISDPFLVACATVGSFFPYIGTAVYAIVRPPEFIEDARERDLEIKAAELRVRQLTELSCPNCEYPVEKTFLRCPQCQRRLKDPCHKCGKPVDPRWSLCPYCETPLARRRRERPAKRQAPPRKKAAPPAGEEEAPPRAASKPPPSPKRTQRSSKREPDPDPRQA
jgi:Double zinc ribbon